MKLITVKGFVHERITGEYNSVRFVVCPDGMMECEIVGDIMSKANDIRFSKKKYQYILLSTENALTDCLAYKRLSHLEYHDIACYSQGETPDIAIKKDTLMKLFDFIPYKLSINFLEANDVQSGSKTLGNSRGKQKKMGCLPKRKAV